MTMRQGLLSTNLQDAYSKMLYLLESGPNVDHRVLQPVGGDESVALPEHSGSEGPTENVPEVTGRSKDSLLKEDAQLNDDIQINDDAFIKRSS